jgi:hypothetical protein
MTSITRTGLVRAFIDLGMRVAERHHELTHPLAGWRLQEARDDLELVLGRPLTDG